MIAEPSRAAYLARVLPGDLIHGSRPSGASLICLVTEVTANTIKVRRITTQANVVFDRASGSEVGADGMLDSIAPLPNALHAIMMGLERHDRLYVKDGDGRLTAEEMAALVALAKFYREHTLPSD